MSSDQAMRFHAAFQQARRAGGPTPNMLAGLTLDPQAPDYRSRLPPPDPDPPAAATPPVPPPVTVTTSGAAPTGDKRVVITYGPYGQVYMVGLEVAPDWDVERVYQVGRSTLEEMLPLVRQLAKVKDLTGEFRETQHLPADAERAQSGAGASPGEAEGAPADGSGSGADRPDDPAMGERNFAAGLGKSTSIEPLVRARASSRAARGAGARESSG